MESVNTQAQHAAAFVSPPRVATVKAVHRADCWMPVEARTRKNVYDADEGLSGMTKACA